MARRTNSDVELNLTVLNGIIGNLDGNIADAIAKAGFALEGHTKVNIQQMDAIDTGAMLNSVYTSLKGGGGDVAMGAARARNPDAQIDALPVPTDSHTAYVGPSVEYAAEVHWGSGTTEGRPFLLQAVQDTEPEFRRLLAEAVTNGK